MNCGTCKYWGVSGKSNEFYSPNPNLKFCSKIEDGYDDLKQDEAIAVTKSYEESCLMTSKDFGCVLYEEKEMTYDEEEDVDESPDGDVVLPLDGDDDDGADYQEDDED